MEIIPINQFKINIRLTCYISGLLGIILMMVWLFSFIRSMQSFYKGESSLKGEQYMRAITFFDRSIHWYTPFNPYVRKSAERLWEIGKNAEQQGDTKLSLIAYRTIRRGFFSASSFYQPGRKWIELCESKIFKLTKLQTKNRQGRHRAESLKKEDLFKKKADRPDIIWTIILEIGFLGWVGTILCFIMSGALRGREPKSSALKNLKWVMMSIIFFTIWIIGMIWA